MYTKRQVYARTWAHVLDARAKAESLAEKDWRKYARRWHAALTTMHEGVIQPPRPTPGDVAAVADDRLLALVRRAAMQAQQHGTRNAQACALTGRVIVRLVGLLSVYDGRAAVVLS